MSDIAEARKKLDSALFYAQSKWESQVSYIVEAYYKAYNNQKLTLEQVEQLKNTPSSYAEFLVPIVLPALLGGFAGAMVAASAKGVIDATVGAVKVGATIAAETTKTVVADTYKAEVKLVYESLIETSGFKPTSTQPGEFAEQAKRKISLFVAAAADALNDSYRNDQQKTGKKPSYFDVVMGLYNSPFIWNAPRVDEMWTVDELAPVLELFLWADWSRHRDVPWWTVRIMTLTSSMTDVSREGQVAYANYIEASKSVKMLNPILERMDKCKVNRAYVTQGIFFENGYRFLNPLWIKNLGNHYKNSLLADLINGLDPKKKGFSIEKRPHTYKLM